MKRTLLTLTTSFFCINTLLSINCETDNWGFENGNFDNWDVTGSVSLENSGTDYYGGYPWVYQNSGSYSVKISGDEAGMSNGSISRSIDVPSEGITYFNFHFAMSIFNYPHPASDAAKFYVEFFDQNNNLIDCPYYECYYSEDEGPQGVDGFNETNLPAINYNPMAVGDGPELYNVSYSDWTDVRLDLSAYAGQTIKAVFRVQWCTFGPDWAYALVDVDCPINNKDTFKECTNEFPVYHCSIDDMSAYEWYDPSNTLLGNGQCMNINTPGIYKCIVSPSNIECSGAENLEFKYNFLEIPQANFTSENVCEYDSLELINTSVFSSENIESIIWDFHNSDSVLTYDAKYLYGNYGEKSVSLTVASANGCFSTMTKQIEIYAVPDVKFSALNNKGCTELCVDFLNETSIQAGGINKYIWELGQEDESENFSVSSCYSNNSLETKTFDISLTAISNNQCASTLTKVNIVEVYPQPIANFNAEPNFLDFHQPQTRFNNTSLLADYNSWDIGGFYQSNEESPVYSFSTEEENTFNVCLYIETIHGCMDTTCEPVTMKGKSYVYIPNSFTPNNNNLNDLFKPVCFGIAEEGFEFNIYDRWGKVVYKSVSLNDCSWDGSIKNSGKKQDVYSWILKCKGKYNSEQFYKTGLVNMVK